MAALTIQHAKSNTVADVTGTLTVFNSAGTTVTAAATDLVRPSDWNSAHNVTFNLSASDLTGLVNATGELSVSTSTNGLTIYEPAVFVNFYEPFFPVGTASQVFAPSVGSYYLDPVDLPNISGGQANFFFANPATAFGGSTTLTSNSTGSYSKYQTNYHRLALYTQVETNHSVLTRVWSTEYQWVMSEVLSLTTGAASMSAYKSAFFSIPAQFDSTGGMTYSTLSTTASSAIVSTSTASSIMNNMLTGFARYISGSVVQPVGMAGSVPSGKYWMAYGFSSSSSSTGTNYGAGAIMPAHSIMAISQANLQAFKKIGSTTTNISSYQVFGEGYFSTTSQSAPASIGTDGMFVSSTTANNRIYWNYDKVI